MSEFIDNLMDTENSEVSFAVVKRMLTENISKLQAMEQTITELLDENRKIKGEIDYIEQRKQDEINIITEKSTVKRPRKYSAAHVTALLKNYGKHIERADIDSHKDYLIDNLIPKDSLTILGGAAKIGKSILSMQLIHDVITQETFLGNKIIRDENHPIKCLYITDDETTQACFWHFKEIFGDDEGIEQVRVAAETKLRYADGGLLDLVEFLAKQGYNLFIIDNFRSFGIDAGINDHIKEKTAERMQWMTDMCKELHISIVLIHHTRKNKRKNNGDITEELAGTKAIPAAATSVIILERTNSKKIKLTAVSKYEQTQELLLTLTSNPLRFQAEDVQQAKHNQERAEYLNSAVHAVFEKIFNSTTISDIYECQMSDLISIAKENNVKLCLCDENTPINIKARSVAVQLNKYRNAIYKIDDITYTSRRTNGKTIYRFEKNSQSKLLN